jgi:hypothetical protein
MVVPSVPYKDFLNRLSEKVGYVKGQIQGRVIPPCLNGTDGLPGYADRAGKILLAQSPFLAELFNPVVQQLSLLSYDVKVPLHDKA